MIKAKTSEFTCDRACSHRSWGDGSNSYMWFNHVLPQIRDKRYLIYIHTIVYFMYIYKKDDIQIEMRIHDEDSAIKEL